MAEQQPEQIPRLSLTSSSNEKDMEDWLEENGFSEYTRECCKGKYCLLYVAINCSGSYILRVNSVARD